MQVPVIQRWLWIWAGLSLGGALLSLGGAWAWSVATPSTNSVVAPPTPNTATRSTPSEKITLASFDRLGEINLRAPLLERPGVGPGVRPRGPVLKLAGTIVDPQDPRASTALLTWPDGHTELRRIGELVDGIEILEVADQSARLRQAGESLLLTVDASDNAAGGMGP